MEKDQIAFEESKKKKKKQKNNNPKSKQKTMLVMKQTKLPLKTSFIKFLFQYGKKEEAEDRSPTFCPRAMSIID